MQLSQKLCLSIQLFIKKGLTISTKGKDKQKGINHIMPVDLAINHFKFNILHLKQKKNKKKTIFLIFRELNMKHLTV